MFRKRTSRSRIEEEYVFKNRRIKNEKNRNEVMKQVKAEREKRQGEGRRRSALLFYSMSKTSFFFLIFFTRSGQKKDLLYKVVTNLLSRLIKGKTVISPSSMKATKPSLTSPLD